MKKKIVRGRNFFIFIVIMAVFIFFEPGLAQNALVIQLPAADTKGGKPLMQALKMRKTSREFSNKKLPLEVLSDLLWAADGINREDSGGRTAPSAMNRREIDIYIALDSGLYLYEPLKHKMVEVLSDDIRALTGKQEFIKEAPVNLIYVANLERGGKMGERSEFYAACDTGFISQNVYLYCASKELATVVRGSFDEVALAKAIQLKPNQKIILTQTVGYPK